MKKIKKKTKKDVTLMDMLKEKYSEEEIERMIKISTESSSKIEE